MKTIAAVFGFVAILIMSSVAFIVSCVLSALPVMIGIVVIVAILRSCT